MCTLSARPNTWVPAGPTAAAGDPLLQCVGHRTRLLVDLLEHVVAVRTLLGGIGREFALVRRPLHAAAVAIDHASFGARDLGHVALLEEHEASGDGQERRDV